MLSHQSSIPNDPCCHSLLMLDTRAPSLPCGIRLPSTDNLRMHPPSKAACMRNVSASADILGAEFELQPGKRYQVRAANVCGSVACGVWRVACGWCGASARGRGRRQEAGFLAQGLLEHTRKHTHAGGCRCERHSGCSCFGHPCALPVPYHPTEASRICVGRRCQAQHPK